MKKNFELLQLCHSMWTLSIFVLKIKTPKLIFVSTNEYNFYWVLMSFHFIHFNCYVFAFLTTLLRYNLHSKRIIHFKNTMIFHKFRVVKPSPQPSFRAFPPALKDLLCPSSISLHSYPQPEAIIDLHSNSTDLPFLNFSSKGNYTLCNILRLTSLT